MEIGDRVVVVAKVGMEQMEQPKESLGAEEIRALSLSLLFLPWDVCMACFARRCFGVRAPAAAERAADLFGVNMSCSAASRVPRVLCDELGFGMENRCAPVLSKCRRCCSH